LKFLKGKKRRSICHFGTKFSREDKTRCPAILIEVDGSTNFAVEKVDVPAGSSEYNNRIGFAEVIS